jgi:hypothetical protein
MAFLISLKKMYFCKERIKYNALIYIVLTIIHKFLKFIVYQNSGHFLFLNLFKVIRNQQCKEKNYTSRPMVVK